MGKMLVVWILAILKNLPTDSTTVMMPLVFQWRQKSIFFWNKRDKGELRGIAKCTFLSHIFFVGQFSDGLPVYKTPPA